MADGGSLRRANTDGPHPLDRVCADLDSAYENHVCGTGKQDSRMNRLHRWTRTKVRMISS